MLVWTLFLIILFATNNCLSVTMPKTKDKKDVEMSGNTMPKTEDKKDVQMSGNKTVDIALVKDTSINHVVEYQDRTRESMDDYERISSYVIFYVSRMILNTWSLTYNNTNSKT